MRFFKIISILGFQFFTFVILATGQNTKVQISGILIHCKFKQASLYQNGKETTLLSQAIIDTNGKFNLQTEVKNTNIFKLQFEDGMYVSLIITPGEKIEITGDIEDFMNTLTIKGSIQSELIYESNKQLGKFKSLQDSINNVYYKGMQTGISDSIVKVLTDEYMKIAKLQDDYIIAFVQKNADYITCLFIIDKLSIDDYFSSFDYLDEHLFKKYPENLYVQNFHTRIQNAKKLAIGSLAPEISLPDPDGNMFSLSSLKGKMVVIDFWASWCGPCRKESPNMVRLYNTYHEKGLEILSVSLDKTKDAWVKAIKDDGLAWHHVSDLKFWQCEAALTYNVTSVPYTVLLDREGKIIAKGLRGEDLIKKVDELLK
jgi:peroxiredoxin